MRSPQRVGGSVRAAVLASIIVAGTAVSTPARADGAVGREDARLAGATSRCTRAAELLACYEALNLRPNSPDLLVAEADALVLAKRPGEAIGVYRNALTVGANRVTVAAKIALAAAARRPLLGYCKSHSGESAERACDSAWLPGAPDEVTIFKRRAQLLLQDNHASAALEADLAAARLRPRDRAVAHSVVTLVTATGRKDASALAALSKAKELLRHPERTPAESGALMAATPDEPVVPPLAPVHFSNDADKTRSN